MEIFTLLGRHLHATILAILVRLCARRVARNWIEYDFLSSPLDILRKGLAKLMASVGTWRDGPKAKLAKREPISFNRPHSSGCPKCSRP